MKYINKYIKFFENETLVEPINQTETPKKTDKIENKTASEELYSNPNLQMLAPLEPEKEKEKSNSVNMNYKFKKIIFY